MEKEIEVIIKALFDMIQRETRAAIDDYQITGQLKIYPYKSKLDALINAINELQPLTNLQKKTNER